MNATAVLSALQTLDSQYVVTAAELRILHIVLAVRYDTDHTVREHRIPLLDPPYGSAAFRISKHLKEITSKYESHAQPRKVADYCKYVYMLELVVKVLEIQFQADTERKRIVRKMAHVVTQMESFDPFNICFDSLLRNAIGQFVDLDNQLAPSDLCESMQVLLADQVFAPNFFIQNQKIILTRK